MFFLVVLIKATQVLAFNCVHLCIVHIVQFTAFVGTAPVPNRPSVPVDVPVDETIAFEWGLEVYVGAVVIAEWTHCLTITVLYRVYI